MANENKNVLRKFDTSANLEADVSILAKQWCWATDLSKLAIKKSDGTWEYIGTAKLWDEDAINDIYTTENAGDDLKLTTKFELNNINSWSTPSYSMGPTSLLSLYQMSGEGGLSSNCYYDSNRASWINGSTAYFPKKIGFTTDLISFKIDSSDTAAGEIAWTGAGFYFEKDDPYFDKMLTFTYKDGSDTCFVVDNNGMSCNKTRDGAGYKFEAEFGTDNYIKIVKVWDGLSGVGATAEWGEAQDSIEVKITVGGGEITRYIPIYDGIPQ